MALEDLLSRGRALAAYRRRSSCDIGRETGETTTVDRLKVPVVARIHTATSFRLAQGGQRSSAGGTSAVTIGGTVYETATAVGHLPFDLADLKDRDIVAVTAGDWPGTFWRVIKATMQDEATERRVPLEQIQRPAGWPA